MEHTRKHRTAKWPFVLIALGILGGTTGYFGWQYHAQQQNAAPSYAFSAVQRGTIEDVVTATGTLQPRDYVDVGAQVSGQVEKIFVEVGSEVKAGDLLVKIDPTLFVAKVDASRAQLRYQKAQLLDREAQLSLAEIQYTRQQNLMAEEATTTESVQSAEVSLRSARAQIEMLKAQIEQTESSLRADEANLNYAKIFAPMDGTVVSITARQGQTINANQQAPILLRIADLRTMTVQTQVSEADISRLKVGMDAYFTTLGSQGRRWQGKLRRIEPTPTVENNVVLYNALFDVDNANHALMPQMTAQVFFVVASAQDALLVPAAAVATSGTAPRRERPAGSEGRQPGQGSAAGRGEMPRVSKGTVQVRNAQGVLESREVETGVTNRVQVQIIKGLQEGEEVVIGQSARQNTGATGAGIGGMPGGMPRIR